MRINNPRVVPIRYFRWKCSELFTLAVFWHDVVGLNPHYVPLASDQDGCRPGGLIAMEQVIVALALIFILALLLVTPTPAVWLLVGFGVIGLGARTNVHLLILPEKRRTLYSLTRDEIHNCQWLKPKLVAQIEFAEWTPDGHLRHASFAGLRNDKEPRRILREE